jgi:hypothetical protein
MNHLFPMQSISASNLSTASNWASHPPFNGHVLDLREAQALRLSPVDQGMMGGGDENNFAAFDEYDDYQSGPSRGLASSLTFTAWRLTSLNMALYECASKLPSIRASRTGSADTIHIPRVTGTNARRAALLAIDEVFRVTNEFIDVMKGFSPTMDRPNIINPTTPTPVSHPPQGASAVLPSHEVPQLLASCRERLPPAAMSEGGHEPETPALATQPFSHQDEATMFTFLSCHCLLTDIYEAIFEVIRRCLKGSYAESHSAAGIILPQLQVGGSGGVSSPALRVDFDGPRLPPATVSMYLVLVTTLSSQLWERVGEVMGDLGRDGSSEQAPIARVVLAGPIWDMAVTRTHNLFQTMETVQRSLQR